MNCSSWSSGSLTTLNDWRPVALTSIISKCFEKLVRDFTCSSLPATLDPLQFAYRQNRSIDDAIALILHTALSHLDKKNRYVRIMFVDYSSAFNTIVPSRLDIKLRDLGLNSSLCSWILNFLTDRRQVVKLAGITSSSLTLSTGAPQGCVLSPLLYSLYTHDCTARHSSNVIIKSADDTTAVGLISSNNEEVYREKVRKQESVPTPITINGAAVERVSSFRFLGVHITEELTWTEHTTRVVKKAQQRLFLFLRRLRRFGMDPRILRTFYTCTVESVLTGSITTWYGGCTAIERKALQRVVRTAQYITGVQLPNLLDLYTSRCLRKTRKILKDSTHPSHRLFSQLPRHLRQETSEESSQHILRPPHTPVTPCSNLCPLDRGTGTSEPEPPGSGTAFTLELSNWSHRQRLPEHDYTTTRTRLHHYQNTTAQLPKHDYTTTRTRLHHYQNTTTPLPEHDYTTTRTRLHHYQNMSTPLPEHNYTSTRTGLHHYQNRTTPLPEHDYTTTRTGLHHYQNMTTPLPEHNYTTTRTGPHHYQNMSTPLPEHDYTTTRTQLHH
ncbi:hypothetical protein NFI96_002906 [Prochilodus magdalenae]|nr:hypothetical protein NFI96_002906 [Prochilodus magdalenae]